jgi:hypothetical protein
MTPTSRALLLTLCALGCSSEPTGPLTQPDLNAPSAGPSSGIQLIVKTTGENLPAQLKFFVCGEPRVVPGVELSFLCRFTLSASGTINSNGGVVTRTAAGVWRAALELPANCRPNPPFAEFYRHTVVGQSLTVVRNAITPTTFSVACL